MPHIKEQPLGGVLNQCNSYIIPPPLLSTLHFMAWLVISGLTDPTHLLSFVILTVCRLKVTLVSELCSSLKVGLRLHSRTLGIALPSGLKLVVSFSQNDTLI